MSGRWASSGSASATGVGLGLPPAPGSPARPGSAGLGVATAKSAAFTFVSVPLPADPPGSRSMLDPAGGAGAAVPSTNAFVASPQRDRVDRAATDRPEHHRAAGRREARRVRHVRDRRVDARPRSRSAGGGRARGSSTPPTSPCASRSSPSRSRRRPRGPSGRPGLAPRVRRAPRTRPTRTRRRSGPRRPAASTPATTTAAAPTGSPRRRRCRRDGRAAATQRRGGEGQDQGDRQGHRPCASGARHRRPPGGVSGRWPRAGRRRVTGGGGPAVVADGPDDGCIALRSTSRRSTGDARRLHRGCIQQSPGPAASRAARGDRASRTMCLPSADAEPDPSDRPADHPGGHRGPSQANRPRRGAPPLSRRDGRGRHARRRSRSTTTTRRPRRPAPAARRTAAPAAPPRPARRRPRPGIGYAFRSSFRPLDLRGDLKALPRLLRHPAFLVPADPVGRCRSR